MSNMWRPAIIVNTFFTMPLCGWALGQSIAKGDLFFVVLYLALSILIGGMIVHLWKMRP